MGIVVAFIRTEGLSQNYHHVLARCFLGNAAHHPLDAVHGHLDLHLEQSVVWQRPSSHLNVRPAVRRSSVLFPGDVLEIV